MTTTTAHPELAKGADHAIEGASAVQRARLLFFLAAGLSLLLSVYLFFGGHREQGIFVGLWVPSILSAGSLLIGRNA